jgi:large subunit ribosomal protein L19e
MELGNVKSLASRVLSLGKGRIVFNKARLADIKEAITKQDVRDLEKDGAIKVKEIKGKKTIVKRKTRKRAGSVKKKVNTRKRDYVNLTRKLRGYIKELLKHETIDREKYTKLRKEIRAKSFRSKAHLKERLTSSE